MTITNHLAHTAINAALALPITLILLWRARRSRRINGVNPAQQNAAQVAEPQAYLRLLDLIKAASGPADVLSHWRDVYPAPSPTMQSLNTGEVRTLAVSLTMPVRLHAYTEIRATRTFFSELVDSWHSLQNMHRL